MLIYEKIFITILFLISKCYASIFQYDIESLRLNAHLTPEIAENITVSVSDTELTHYCIKKCRNIVKNRYDRKNFCLEYPEKLSDDEIDLYRVYLITALKAGNLQAMYNFAVTTYGNSSFDDSHCLYSTRRLFVEIPTITHTLLKKIADTPYAWDYLPIENYRMALWLVSRNFREGIKCFPNERKAISYAVKASNFGCVRASDWLKSRHIKPSLEGKIINTSFSLPTSISAKLHAYNLHLSPQAKGSSQKIASQNPHIPSRKGHIRPSHWTRFTPILAPSLLQPPFEHLQYLPQQPDYILDQSGQRPPLTRHVHFS